MIWPRCEFCFSDQNTGYAYIVCPHCAGTYTCISCIERPAVLLQLKSCVDFNPNRREYYTKGYCLERHSSVDLID